MKFAAIAWVAALPLAIGPLPAEGRSLVVQLCSGGTLSIPIGDGDDSPPPPCPQKGCHAGTCRKRI